jgi:hypothetical protein
MYSYFFQVNQILIGMLQNLTGFVGNGMAVLRNEAGMKLRL